MKKQRTVLTVDGRPFIAIAGEAHNSSSSNADYMNENVWPMAKKLGLNTILIPAYWELIEPVEGQYEFDLIDELIMQARENEIKLVFLWFGAWKNAQCMYAPEWVKTDMERFPRAQVVAGKKKTALSSFFGMEYTTLSYMGDETCKADAKCFAAFMEHLKLVDEKEQTVVAVQVENETGLQGSDREHSPEADAVFASQVPEGFVNYLRENTAEMDEGFKTALLAGKPQGTWEEVFGSYAGEVFSAYHIASYVEKVAAAGLAKYQRPLAVNCWLDKGEEAGKYPSGGPVAKMIEVWHYCAPSIDVICPDIYVKNFTEICDQYTRDDNPLFIPETATHSHCAPRLVYAIGHHHAACFAPFGFEDMGQPFDDMAGFLFGMDVTDPLLSQPQNVDEYRICTDTLNSMMDLLTAKYGTNDLQAVISEKIPPVDMSQLMAGKGAERTEDNTMMFGTFGFQIAMSNPMIKRQDGVCMILKESEDTFYIFANGCGIKYFSADEARPNCDIIALDEGSFKDGKWVAKRRLNGDESARLSYDQYTLLRIKLLAYN